MIGEINYEIVVGVIHNFSAIVFFIAVFICGLSSSMFMKEGTYGPSFMNMPYMMGNFDWFPTSRLQMVSRVTLDTGCGGGSGLVGGGGLGGWVWFGRCGLVRKPWCCGLGLLVLARLEGGWVRGVVDGVVDGVDDG